MIYAGIYEPQGINVLNPTQIVCIKLDSDFFNYGSYSSVSIEASWDGYGIMTKSIKNDDFLFLFFAREATICMFLL